MQTGELVRTATLPVQVLRLDGHVQVEKHSVTDPLSSGKIWSQRLHLPFRTFPSYQHAVEERLSLLVSLFWGCFKDEENFPLKIPVRLPEFHSRPRPKLTFPACHTHYSPQLPATPDKWLVFSQPLASTPAIFFNPFSLFLTQQTFLQSSKSSSHVTSS